MKSDHQLERNRLTGQECDRVNALRTAVGYNFRKLLRGVFFAIIYRLVGRLNPVVTAAGVIQRDPMPFNYKIMSDATAKLLFQGRRASPVVVMAAPLKTLRRCMDHSR